MTFGKSLKLTAISVGLVSIAITGCKKNSDDNNSLSTKEKETKPQITRNLMIKLDNGIPLGGCATYKIILTNQDGSNVDITNHTYEGTPVSVNLLNNASKNKFILNRGTHQVCTVNKNSYKINGNTLGNAHLDNAYTEYNEIATLGDSVTLTARSEGLFNSATAKVIQGDVMKDFTVEFVDNNGNIDVPRGARSSEFRISYINHVDDINNSVKQEKKYITSAENLKLEYHSNQFLDLKTVIRNKKVYFYFEVPKNHKIGIYNYYLTVNQKTQILKINVLEGELSSVSLVDSTSKIHIPTVLNLNLEHHADVIVKYSDNDESIDLTAQNYLVSGTTNVAKHNIIRVESDSPKVVSAALIDGGNANSVAYDNRVKLKAENIGKFDYLPAILTVFVNSADANDINGKTAQTLYYVNHKPVITDVIFEKDGKQENANKIAVGGATVNKSKYCTKLSSISYKLGEKGVVKKLTQKEDLDNFEIILADEFKENFNITNKNIVCAEASAKGLKAELNVSLIKDETVSKKYTVEADSIVSTNVFVLSFDGKTPVSEVKFAGDKVESQDIVGYHVSSDNNISKEVVKNAEYTKTYVGDQRLELVPGIAPNSFKVKLVKDAKFKDNESFITGTIQVVVNPGYSLAEYNRYQITVVYSK